LPRAVFLEAVIPLVPRQFVLATPTVLWECGKELAGLAEGKVWTLLGLVDKG